MMKNKKINVKPAGWERKTIDFYKTKCYGEGEWSSKSRSKELRLKWSREGGNSEDKEWRREDGNEEA